MKKIFEKVKYRIKYEEGFYSIYKRTFKFFWLYWDRKFSIITAKNKINQLIKQDKIKKEQKAEKHWIGIMET